MAVEVEELYLNLNKLLHDICQFLSEETNLDKLSSYSRKQADELIQRSKEQLQEIAKVTCSNDDKCDSGEYMDMERKTSKSPAKWEPLLVEDNSAEDKSDIYSSVEEPQPKVVAYPYAELPAKDLSKDLKFGHFTWKTRFILPFNKRVYGGIHNNWLLIYASERDLKPLQSFDLKFHSAQLILGKQGRPTQDFELVSVTSNKKTYHFVAQAYKDMIQWVAHINKVHDLINKNVEATPLIEEEQEDDDDDDESKTYDTIAFKPVSNTEKIEEDEEEIYDDIDVFTSRVKVADKPPDLPSRTLKSNKFAEPLPPLPIETSTESIASYDAVDKLSSEADESAGSFSADEEDDTYEAFVTKTAPQKPPSHPNTPNKPPITKKPEGLSFRRKIL